MCNARVKFAAELITNGVKDHEKISGQMPKIRVNARMESFGIGFEDSALRKFYDENKARFMFMCQLIDLACYNLCIKSGEKTWKEGVPMHKLLYNDM